MSSRQPEGKAVPRIDLSHRSRTSWAYGTNLVCAGFTVLINLLIPLHVILAFPFACRRIETLKQLSEDGICTATCDVCSQDSVDACIAGIIQQAGSIDVLINNAGEGLSTSDTRMLVSQAWQDVHGWCLSGRSHLHTLCGIDPRQAASNPMHTWSNSSCRS